MKYPLVLLALIVVIATVSVGLDSAFGIKSERVLIEAESGPTEPIIDLREPFEHQVTLYERTVLLGQTHPDAPTHFMPAGGGFFVNANTIVTAGHVALVLSEGEVLFGLTAVAQLPGIGRESAITFRLGDPVYSRDGLFALYRMSDGAAPSLDFSPIAIAHMENIKAGMPAFRASLNGWRKLYAGGQEALPLPEFLTHVIFTDWKKSAWATYSAASRKKIFSPLRIDLSPQELLDKTIGIASLIPGDSGSPIFIWDPQKKQFYLIGMAKFSPAGAMRADVLATFLHEQGISTDIQP